jgi:hypothetical protein
MKSVRVTTLEVNEGEGMRGSSHFTGRPRAGFFTLFTVARFGALISRTRELSVRAVRCPRTAVAHAARFSRANRSRIIRTKSASGHSAAV